MNNSKNCGTAKYEQAIHFWKMAVIVDVNQSSKLDKIFS